MPSATTTTCIVCNTLTTKLCSGCKDAHYCSKLCQKGDFPTHKLVCKCLSILNKSARPSSKHYKAIFFSINDPKPHFIWLDCSSNCHEENLLGDKADGRLIEYNKVLKRQLTLPIRLDWRDQYLMDDLAVPESVTVIRNAKNKEGECFKWQGPLCAVGRMTTDHKWKGAARDLNMQDFRHLCDFFITDKSIRNKTIYRHENISTASPFGMVMEDVDWDDELLGYERRCILDVRDIMEYYSFAGER